MRWWHPFLPQPGYSQALAGPGQSWCQVLLGLESWARNPTSKLDDVLPHHKLQCYNKKMYNKKYTIICNHIQSYAIICNSILYNNIQSSLIIIPALYFGKAAWNDKFIRDHSLVGLGMEAPKICSVLGGSMDSGEVLTMKWSPSKACTVICKCASGPWIWTITPLLSLYYNVCHSADSSDKSRLWFVLTDSQNNLKSLC